MKYDMILKKPKWGRSTF